MEILGALNSGRPGTCTQHHLAFCSTHLLCNCPNENGREMRHFVGVRFSCYLPSKREHITERRLGYLPIRLHLSVWPNSAFMLLSIPTYLYSCRGTALVDAQSVKRPVASVVCHSHRMNVISFLRIDLSWCHCCMEALPVRCSELVLNPGTSTLAGKSG